MKLLKLAYSVLTYLFFLSVFNYLLIFLGGDFLKEWLPLLSNLKTIDSGTAHLALPGLPSWLGNIVLLIMFSVHHSVMARSGVKEVLTKLIPRSSERSTFVLLTCLILSWMYLAWQPQTTQIWTAEGNVTKTLITLLFVTGGGLVLWSTFMISHWRLFGLAQAWQDFRGHIETPDTFSTPALYKYSRHPMYVGILIVLWATPTMNLGHLVLASVWSIYVCVGIYFEEKDLVRQFGTQYLEYQRNVSKLLPFKRPSLKQTSTIATSAKLNQAIK